MILTEALFMMGEENKKIPGFISLHKFDVASSIAKVVGTCTQRCHSVWLCAICCVSTVSLQRDSVNTPVGGSRHAEKKTKNKTTLTDLIEVARIKSQISNEDEVPGNTAGFVQFVGQKWNCRAEKQEAH